LYDTGGFDTLDYSGSAVAEEIDLREGQWSTILGNPGGTDTDLSLRIAYGVTIENAFGGASDDSLQGNEVNNILRGNEGNDILAGAGGQDQMFGGAGDDRYIWRFGDGRDSIFETGAGGVDTLEIRDSSGTLGALEQGLVFRRLGNDLRIDLRVEGQAAQGTVLIKDYGTAGSEVETLSLFAADGSRIGPDVDLTTIFSNSDDSFKRFEVTTAQNANGAIAAAV
jgi:Ca2+-binding RTX toxin-like protein